MNYKFANNINKGHPLGKGEVVSSILTGSTRKAHKSRAFEIARCRLDTFRYATKHEHNISSSGKSVDYVPRTFTRLGDRCCAGEEHMNIEEERERARRLSRRLRERDAEIARLREALKNIYIGGIGERGWTLDEIRAYALNAYSAPTSEGVNYG